MVATVSLWMKVWNASAPTEGAEFAVAGERARAARAGLWLDKDPIPPWEWRSKKRGDSPKGRGVNTLKKR
jgi:endonuclease YncB( thermonuclease family)